MVLHRREYTIFGAPRQLRRIPSAQCGSSRYAKLSSSFSILLTLFLKHAATKLGLPMAAPKISSPSLLFLFILLSIAFRSTGDQSSHFSILSSKPHPSPKFVNKFNAVQNCWWVPARMPSSKYQLCCTRFGNFVSISLMIGHRASENKSGPKGSPCWTPDWLLKYVLLKCK